MTKISALAIVLAAGAASAQAPLEWPASARPFDCNVWPVVQGAQPTDLGRIPGNGGALLAPTDEATRAWAESAGRPPQIVPVRLQTTPFPEVQVINEGGACRPRIGSPMLVYAGEGHPELGHRLMGCGTDLEFSRLAFDASCRMPAALRYTPFEHHIRRMGRGAPREPEVSQIPVPAFRDPVASSAPITQRYRVSRAIAGDEEWMRIELHARQNTAERSCPNEAFAARTWTRPVHGAWTDAPNVSGELLGVFHDGHRAIALVTSEMAFDGELCRGGPGCEVIAVHRRGANGAFTVAQRYPFQVRSGDPVPRRSILQQGDRMCDAG